MKNQFEPNKKYFTISAYVIVVTFICALIVKAVFDLSTTLSILSSLLSILSPFLIGFFIAYLMTPFVDAIYKYFFKKLFKDHQQALFKLLSIFIAYIIVIAVAIGLLTYIIPNMINNLSDIVNSFQDIYTRFLAWLTKLEERFPNLDLNYIEDTIRSQVPTALSSLTDFVSNLAPAIYGASISVVRWIINFLIAIIVSCYMLIDKGMMTRGFKRIVYAFFKKSRADYIWNTLRRANTVFSNYIIGKTIDSLIIGILCFILMCILNIPFASFISIIVCVTNMIPYFGPFLGALPSAIILLAISPAKAAVFIVMIIVLQQIDGNIIGPRILGESTGLRPIWIIFAISVGGWAAGVIGMFLGVPCVAVISSLLNDAVSIRLDQKNIDLPMVRNEKIRKNAKKKKSIFAKDISKSQAEPEDESK